MKLSPTRALMMSCVAAALMPGAGFGTAPAAASEPLLKNHTIAYVLTDEYWAIYQTADGKAECPEGFTKMGPREQFRALFPEDGTKRSVVDTQLAREAQIWNPKPIVGPDPFPYPLAGGKYSYGVNLTGTVGPNDFTSPDGEKGIKNQLYRALGCNEHFRGPDGVAFALTNRMVRQVPYNRIMIELTKVDDLGNDPDVDVTIERGLDTLLTDATGDIIIPGGTQRLDTRFGKKYNQHLHGKIVDGVLWTDPADIRIMHTQNEQPAEELYRHGVFRLKVSAESAEGVLAGFADVDRLYFSMNRNLGTYFQAYGRLSSQSLYKKLRELADGYPDPKTGANTAISSAMTMMFKQVFVQRPGEKKEVASN